VKVILPLAAPGIAAAFLLEFASAWNSFLLPLLFLSSESRMTVALGIDRFLSGYGVEPGPLMAFTLLVSLPLLVLFPRMLVAALAPFARGDSGVRKAAS
jgi:multiple sugar transport system permease protein